MNEILVVNPRSRRNAKGQFVKRVRARGRRSHATATRRRRRRNPIAALAANPRRKKRRGKWFAVKAHQRNPIHARRARRRNPISLAAFRPRSILSELIPAAIGGAGALALDVALSKIPTPAALQNPVGKLAVRVVGAIGLGMLAGMLKKNIGRQVTAGALTVVAYNTLRDVVQRVAPSITMQGYDDGMGYIDPAPQLMDGTGMGAYMQPAPTMGAYMQPDASSMGNYGDGM